ncbi:MAG: hypothetical protein WCV62_05900 [Candidatus Peribacteraceae bacterium]|jgi:hypothetical protein
MPVTLYLRVLADEREAYERKGWVFVTDLWPIGGWSQVLMRKEIKE